MGDLKASKPQYVRQSTQFGDQKATYILHEDGLPATGSGTTTGTFTLTLVKDGLFDWKVDTAVVE
jgi:hypothetical protein